MNLKIKIPDEKYDALEQLAESQGKSVEKFINDALPLLSRFNLKENQILLSGKQVSDIGMSMGGKTLKTADDIVKTMQDNFRISVGGADYAIRPEDAHALKAQFDGMGFAASMTFQDYVKAVVTDALSLFLYGSTTGTFAAYM